MSRGSAVFCLVLFLLVPLPPAFGQAGAPPPHGAIPHPRQLAWQRLDYYAFVHFGLNTWTDREWGYGDEDPKLFNPSSFDARAIVRTFKDAGMKGVILTAKHHDGFCLWPTKTTEHNISKSPWKNGQGDLVREFSDACRAEDMKLGIYVSPWDRSHPEYAREGYVKAFHEQIREVLTHYGPIFEIWFDGANGGDGFYGGAREARKIPPNYYRFPDAVEMIRKLQPECVVWSAGDARWGGSEQGHVAYPHWHTMDSKNPGNIATGVAHGDTWMPAEGDVSIRPGWFWHERENNSVKQPAKLMQIWFDCVGRGANLILNVPPDRTGRINRNDAESLLAFRKLRDSVFSTDFASGAKTLGPERAGKTCPSSALTDGDIDTFWSVDDGTSAPQVEMALAKPATFDVIRLREQIRLGQRVDSFAIDLWSSGAWKEIHAGKTIGNQVLVRLPKPVTGDRLRLRITGSPAVPCISEWSLFKMPEIRKNPAETGFSRCNVAKNTWKIVSATAGDASLTIDENPKTFWHTHMDTEKTPPQNIEIDLGREFNISAFTYLPRQDGVAHGMTDKYRFELSRDSTQWENLAEGEFSNIRANPVEQVVPLKKPVRARYLRFTGLHAVEKNHVSAAEIGIIAVP